MTGKLVSQAQFSCMAVNPTTRFSDMKVRWKRRCTALAGVRSPCLRGGHVHFIERRQKGVSSLRRRYRSYPSHRTSDRLHAGRRRVCPPEPPELRLSRGKSVVSRIKPCRMTALAEESASGPVGLLQHLRQKRICLAVLSIIKKLCCCAIYRAVDCGC